MITKTSHLTLFSEIVADYCENHIEHTKYTVCRMQTFICKCRWYILWHADPLLGNNHEMNCTMAITRQQPINSNRGTVFPVWTILTCYEQDKLGVAVS
jgi:hypothetical protein